MDVTLPPRPSLKFSSKSEPSPPQRPHLPDALVVVSTPAASAVLSSEFGPSTNAYHKEGGRPLDSNAQRGERMSEPLNYHLLRPYLMACAS
jgi:hypothetical protein